ncbi:MAG: deoxyribonuclease V [Proteobacteria bacterium]|nr:deoxyribonuclease V [Pseudomonadota bacterium]
MYIEPFALPASAAEARLAQQNLREKLRLQNDFGQLHNVAGVDVGYLPAENLAHASVVLMQLEDFTVLEQVQAYITAEFPYVPGLLSFREIPAILAALKKLTRRPNMLMVDGQGIAHPRRMGIAAHLGLWLDVPSIGVAKSRLFGNFNMPGLKKGDRSPLLAGGECIGTVLRSRDNTNPLFISPGHRVDVATATEITLRCLTRYRLPEPTRLADKFSKCRCANAAKRQILV